MQINKQYYATLNFIIFVGQSRPTVMLFALYCSRALSSLSCTFIPIICLFLSWILNDRAHAVYAHLSLCYALLY